MASQLIWIGIVIGVFFVGIGVSYAHFANTYDPMSMKFHNQELFDQMMSHNPKMSQKWMDSDMMSTMMNDPEMQKMIMVTMHDSNQIQMMEDMMADMMERMQTDPELKQAMMEHMERMQSSRDVMMENTADSMMTAETTILYVDSKLVDCVGVGPQQCMLIKEDLDSEWQMFYNSIEGFEFQEGTEYKISVIITEIENPPADSSSLKYTLVEVLEP